MFQTGTLPSMMQHYHQSHEKKHPLSRALKSRVTSHLGSTESSIRRAMNRRALKPLHGSNTAATKHRHHSKEKRSPSSERPRVLDGEQQETRTSIKARDNLYYLKTIQDVKYKTLGDKKRLNSKFRNALTLKEKKLMNQLKVHIGDQLSKPVPIRRPNYHIMRNRTPLPLEKISRAAESSLNTMDRTQIPSSNRSNGYAFKKRKAT